MNVPKITKIMARAGNKNFVQVFAEGEYLFSVTRPSAENCGLKEGDSLTDELMKNVWETEAGAAFTKAVDLVCRAPKTKLQIQDYLNGKGFDGRATAAAIEKMEQYRYADDAGYAEAYISFYGGSKGKYRLMSELKLKGVSDEIISACEDLLPCQRETALKAAEKFMRNRENSIGNMSKLYRHLAGKGFELSVCGEIVKEISGGAPD